MPDYTVHLTDEQAAATAKCIGKATVGDWLQAQVKSMAEANVGICRKSALRAAGIGDLEDLDQTEIDGLAAARAAKKAREDAAKKTAAPEAPPA